MKVDNEYQKFFRHERFTHHITLPPSYLNEKSVLPVLRKIEFKLNKTFLKITISDMTHKCLLQIPSKVKDEF